MTAQDKVIEHYESHGWTIYMSVCYPKMANEIAHTVNKENKQHQAYAVSMPDGSYTVWYKNLHQSRQAQY